jgi:DNA primase
MTITDEIKDRLDIVSYIQQYVPLKKSGNHYKGLCPFHNEHTPSFMVSADRQSWRCYGSCSDGGDVIAFAMRRHGWSFTEALEELGKIAGVEVKKPTGESQRRDVLRGLVQAAADAYHHALLNRPEAQPIRDYLAQRGITDATIEAFNLGWHPGGARPMLAHLTRLGATEADITAAGLAVRKEDGRVFDRLSSRLIIPIMDERGRVVALAGRRMDDQPEAKYINTPNSAIFDRGHLLFGFQRSLSTAVIVEGYMDVMAAHQAGFTNVMAQMGTGLTEGQLALLKDVSRIVIALDGDDAGQAATRRGVETALKSSRDVRVLTLDAGLDPDDVIRESPARWQALVEEATPVAEWIIERECAHIAANAPMPEREAKARELLPLMVAAESDLCRTDNVQRLALKLQIPERHLLSIAPMPAAAKPAAPAAAPNRLRAPVEAYCIQCLLHNEQWYYGAARVFKELKLEDFGPTDFLNYRPVMQTFLAAINQYDQDVYDYLLANVDPDLLPPFLAEGLSETYFVQQALRLRLQRRKQEIEELLLVGDLEQARLRLKEQATIQTYRKSQ